MILRSLCPVSTAFFLSLGTQAAATNELCLIAVEQELCTALKFEIGLPADYYSSTLLGVSKFIEEDFKFYLTESHGPFSKNKAPTIDYEVNFLSTIFDSEFYGLTKFIVISSTTRVKPFGIIVINSKGALQEIGVSYGYSSYAVLETKDGLYFLYKDRFSNAARSVKIQ